MCPKAHQLGPTLVTYYHLGLVTRGRRFKSVLAFNLQRKYNADAKTNNTFVFRPSRPNMRRVRMWGMPLVDWKSVLFFFFNYKAQRSVLELCLSSSYISRLLTALMKHFESAPANWVSLAVRGLPQIFMASLSATIAK
jgi:hypothetical protein